MFVLKDGQQVGGVKVDPASIVDADGNPASIQGPPRWESSDPNLATVATDPNDPDAVVVRTTEGPGLGQVTITARADADLGEGVKEITFSEVFDVVAGDAVAGTIVVGGTPTDREGGAPPA